MKFIIGSEKVFTDFVNSINKDDKIGLLSHNDLDGVAAVVFLEKILEAKGLDVALIDFLSYGVGMFEKPTLEMKKKKVTKVFLSDINADESDIAGFEKLRQDFDILLIDHHPPHPSLKNHDNIIKNHTHDCSTWVLYNFAKDFYDVEEWDWLVCATMISEWSFKDEDNLKFLQSKYDDIKEDGFFETKSGAIAKKIANALKYYGGRTRKVYDSIKDNNLDQIEKVSKEVEVELESTIKKYKKEAKFYPEKNLYFYYGNPKFGIGNIVVTILSQSKPSTFVFAYDSGLDKVKISFRNNADSQDVNELVKKGMKGLENATGGGHIAAASAIIMRKDFEKFKENILN